MTRSRGRIVLLAVACLSPPAFAVTANPLFRSGYENCSVEGISTTVFESRLVAQFDGRKICIPKSTNSYGLGNFTTCGGVFCTGGAEGCELTVRAADATGSYETGLFNVPVAPDDLSVPITTTGAVVTSCTLLVANLAGDADLDFSMPQYEPGAVTVTSLDTVTADITNKDLSGCGLLGSIIDFVAPFLESQIESRIAADLGPIIADATVTTSICPIVLVGDGLAAATDE